MDVVAEVSQFDLIVVIGGIVGLVYGLLALWYVVARR